MLNILFLHIGNKTKSLNQKGTYKERFTKHAELSPT